MKQKASMRQLRLSYFLTVGVILTLLAISQVIIQLTLHQETATRALSNQVALQALYSQATLKNTLELVIQPGTKTWRNNLQKDIDFMRPEEKKLLEELPDGEQAALQAVDKAFQQVVTAGEQIIYDTDHYDKNNKDRLHDQGQQTLNLFNAQVVYTPALVGIYNDLTTQADASVLRVQIAEICLFTLSVLTVLAEFFFVARPGMKTIQTTVDELQQALDDAHAMN